jgi:DNA phosphorothioation-dependent restriction protein DptG
LTLEYKGYRAVVQYDAEHRMYAGHIQALDKADVAFFGKNKKDLMKNFEGMVNYYELMHDQLSLFPKAESN